MFAEIKEAFVGKFAESPLGKASEGRLFNENVSVYDAVLYDVSRRTILPRENGEWQGDPGDSTWNPDPDYIPRKDNPDGLTWGEILKKYGIDGIKYKDGYPDFSEVSEGTVEIEDFTDDRRKNFAQVDIELAKQRGCTPEEIKKWREENGYTWHECEDMKTMQLVPKEIHNNIPHSGGIEAVKRTHQ